MKKWNVVLGLALVLPLFEVCAAQVTEGSTEAKPASMEDLQRRIEDLEAKQAELIRQLEARGPSDVPGGVEKKEGAEKPPVRSGVGVELYGYIKLDAAWDQHAVDQGDYARWVGSEELKHDDNQFNMTANQTRLGLKFNGPEVGGAKTGGLIEMDFYGGGGENKPNPMLRKAYCFVDWRDLDLSVLGGQDSDVVSPLVPETINYTVLWWVGNIGYRRPQFRVTKGFGLGGDVRLELQAAALRTIGRAPLFNGQDFGPGDSGEDAGFPTFQGRLALSFPLAGPAPTVLGVSGHYGEENLEVDAQGDHARFDSWSVNLELTMPIARWLRLKGEGFLGDDLDAYLGGIGQGVTILRVPSDPADPNSPLVFDRGYEIYSYGGWAMANVGPFGAWSFNAGAGVDNPDNSDLVANNRALNWTAFGNALVKVFQTTQFGLEVSWWHTDYVDLKDGDSLRVQATMIFSF